MFYPWYIWNIALYCIYFSEHLASKRTDTVFDPLVPDHHVLISELSMKKFCSFLLNQIFIFQPTLNGMNLYKIFYLFMSVNISNLPKPQKDQFYMVYPSWNLQILNSFVLFMVFNATFNNISVISWQSVLLVEETGENHRTVARYCQTWLHNFV